MFHLPTMSMGSPTHHSPAKQPVPALRNRYNYDSRAVHYYRMYSRWLSANSDHLKDIYISCCLNKSRLEVRQFGYVHMHELDRNISETREAGCGSTTEMIKEWNRCYIYEGKSLNNRNFILKCMEKYAQRKILFRDTKWLLSNMSYRGRDDQAV